MVTKYIDDKHLSVDTPNTLISLFDKHARHSFGTFEIEKSTLIGELSTMDEGEIETLNREIVELIELQVRLKGIIETAMPGEEATKESIEKFYEKLESLIY